ncbi:hypothetical protein NG841_11975 [Enterococcus faecalis]|uniref:hypothetical protein n=1 Tax=Enterococcus faecalis TaxID=1351 RepID=UPI00209007AC|nr:hypothetical protein [Enterococcus faecalis]MCO5432954.1 hypothetical protein [Enterococcus faecalis]
MKLSNFLLEKIKESSTKKMSLKTFSKVYHKEYRKDLTNKDKLRLASELKYSNQIIINYIRESGNTRIETIYLLKDEQETFSE